MKGQGVQTKQYETYTVSNLRKNLSGTGFEESNLALPRLTYRTPPSQDLPGISTRPQEFLVSGG